MTVKYSRGRIDVEANTLTECPGLMHEADLGFNPRTQEPYGNGYFHCEVCDGEGMVTKIEEFNYYHDFYYRHKIAERDVLGICKKMTVRSMQVGKH